MQLVLSKSRKIDYSKYLNIDFIKTPKDLYNECNLNDFKTYRKLSSQFTNYLCYYGIFDIKKGYSIDHKYSVKQGFIDKIDCRIINNTKNLRVVTKSENSTKSSASVITKHELMSYPIDELWDRFIKNEHPIFPEYTIDSNCSAKNYICHRGFITDKWRKDGIPRLLVETNNEKLSLSLSLNAFDKLQKIDLNRKFTINFVRFKNNKGEEYFYKEFHQCELLKIPNEKEQDYIAMTLLRQMATPLG